MMTWWDRAVCRGLPLRLFILPSRAEEARQVCRGCPVILECREWAVTHCEFGVWGGTTDHERIQIRKARRAQRLRLLGAADDTPKVCNTCGHIKPADQFNRQAAPAASAEEQPWLTAGDSAVNEDPAELGRRLQQWYAVGLALSSQPRVIDNPGKRRNVCRDCQKERYVQWYAEKNARAGG